MSSLIPTDSVYIVAFGKVLSYTSEVLKYWSIHTIVRYEKVFHGSRIYEVV